MGTPLGPKYIPYTYMDPLGQQGNQEGIQGSEGLSCPEGLLGNF